MNRLLQWDIDLCIRFNRVSSLHAMNLLFRLTSRLGNGVFWYGLMLALPFLYPEQGLRASIHMLAAAVPALLIYKALKKTTSRRRPYKVHPSIRQRTSTLDQYSFPSGHTLHAVNFTLIAGGYFPELLAPLSAFSILVALSRPILGLHYPSDVLVGACIGAVVSVLSWQASFIV